MNHQRSISLAVSIAAVAGLDIATSLQTIPDDGIPSLLTVDELNALIDGGLTKNDLLLYPDTVSVDMSEPSDVIDALASFDCGSLDGFKDRIDVGTTQIEKNEILQLIVEEDMALDYPCISQCDAFELFVYTDKWRALRDLTILDPYRAYLNIRGDYSADSVALEYQDSCFVSPFWQYEPQADDVDQENLLLFAEGVLKPRAKQLRYHSGTDYGFPDSWSYKNSDDDWECDGTCIKNDMIADDDFETEFNFRLTFNYFEDDDLF